jgi:hypothetical protein
MPIRPGTLDTFAGSMAEAIETELNLMLGADGLPLLPIDASRETRDRRRLFVAIARGVVQHLAANQASIVVPYDDSGLPRTTTATLTVSMT